MLIKEHFKQFLKNEGIYYMYYMNWRYHTMNRRLLPQQYISHAFPWSGEHIYGDVNLWHGVDRLWWAYLVNNLNYSQQKHIEAKKKHNL